MGNESRPASTGKQIAAPFLTRIRLGLSTGMTSGNNIWEDLSLSEKICDLDVAGKLHFWHWFNTSTKVTTPVISYNVKQKLTQSPKGLSLEGERDLESDKCGEETMDFNNLNRKHTCYPALSVSLCAYECVWICVLWQMSYHAASQQSTGLEFIRKNLLTFNFWYPTLLKYRGLLV